MMPATKALCTILAVSFLFLAGTESAGVAKRSDDSNPLVATVERLTADVARLQAQLGKWLTLASYLV